ARRSDRALLPAASDPGPARWNSATACCRPPASPAGAGSDSICSSPPWRLPPTSFRNAPRDLTSNARLRIGEFQDCGDGSAVRHFGGLLPGEARTWRVGGLHRPCLADTSSCKPPPAPFDQLITDLFRFFLLGPMSAATHEIFLEVRHDPLHAVGGGWRQDRV